jgi:hypothetical protein
MGTRSETEESVSSARADLCRFVSPQIASKYGFDVPEYQGIDQVVEVATTEEKL